MYGPSAIFHLAPACTGCGVDFHELRETGATRCDCTAEPAASAAPAPVRSFEGEPRTGRGVRLVVAAAIVGAFLGLWISPGRAYAEQLEPADRTVQHVRVTYAEQTAPRRMFVELNNGAAYRLRPCALEDSHGCYWDASSMGDGRGWSFVSVHVAGRGECTLYLTHARRNYCDA